MNRSQRVLITLNPENTSQSQHRHLQRWLTYVRLLKKSGYSVFCDNSMVIADPEWNELTTPYSIRPQKKDKSTSILSKLFKTTKKEDSKPEETEQFDLILREQATDPMVAAPLQLEFLYYPYQNLTTPATHSRSPNTLIVNSMFLKKWATDNLHREASSIEVIYPFYDREQFHTKDKASARIEARARMNLDPKTFNVGFSVQDSTKTSDSRAKVVQDTAQAISEGGLCSSLLFDKTKMKLADYYHSLDLFVAPEELNFFDNSILEAMACGIPVFANSKNAAAEVLPSKQCAFAYDTPEQWRDKIHEVSKTLDWLTAIGRQNSERAPLFDENHHLKRFIEVLSKNGIEVI